MSQITIEQRYVISEMKLQGYKQKDIAKVIGKDKSVISRELKRNCDKRSGEYRFELAQKKCSERHRKKRKKVYLTPEILSYVLKNLAKKLSPEQIVGKAVKECIECVSVERIYQYIWSDKKEGGKLYEHLRVSGKRYRKRGSQKDRRGIIRDRVGITERDKIVELRERIGDLEIDTIIGKNHQGAILTINDRVSGMVKLKKLHGKDAKELAIEAVKVLQDWKPYIHTITSDNGKEFSEHKLISESLGVKFYFTHPYRSWERGSNENINGLVRQYIPKEMNLLTITDEYISYVENELNNRPRKRHNYSTPNHIFNKHKVAFNT